MNSIRMERVMSNCFSFSHFILLVVTIVIIAMKVKTAIYIQGEKPHHIWKAETVLKIFFFKNRLYFLEQF